MSQHAVNTQAVVTEYKADGTKTTQRLVGEMIVAVRVDDLPQAEADRLAAEGKFYPLTTDQDGQLRVVPPDWIKVKVEELEVHLRNEKLLTEIRDLLMKIA